MSAGPECYCAGCPHCEAAAERRGYERALRHAAYIIAPLVVERLGADHVVAMLMDGYPHADMDEAIPPGATGTPPEAWKRTNVYAWREGRES